MKTFKKICFIVLTILCLLILGTCIVLYWVNPAFLKRSIDYLLELFKQPLPIVGVSVGFICICVWKIFSSTSLGKKVYSEAKQDCENSLAKAEEYKKIGKEYFDKAQQFKNDTIVVLNDFSVKYDNLTEQLVSVCQTSPNAKIQALGVKIKEQSNVNKQEITEKLDILSEKHEKVAKQSQITLEELLAQFNALKNEVEKVVGKNEEQE